MTLIGPDIEALIARFRALQQTPEAKEKTAKADAEGKRLAVEPTPGPDCPDCQNQRVILVKDERGMTIAKPCHCRAATEAYRLIQASGLSEMLEDMTFTTFFAELDWQKTMYHVALEYVDAVQKGSFAWFAALGETGGGKTHICTAIAGSLLGAGIPVRWIEWSRLKEMGKKRYGNFQQAQDNEAEFNKLKTCRALYIDDFMSKEFTAADIDCAFEIISHRYTIRLPTIISSERGPSRLREVDEAIAGRIIEMSRRYGEYMVYLPLGGGANQRTKNYMIDEAEAARLKSGDDSDGD